jgi:hypothetical protein
MSDEATLDGTFVDKIITADGDEAIVMYSVLGNLETTEAGTTTTELDLHESGTTTVTGT